MARAALIGAPLLLAAALVGELAAGVPAATPAATTVASVELKPDPGSRARGVASFRQRGATLSGWVVVWNLAPGTRHGVHFHGPNGACAGPARDALASHADLVADARGVAFARFSTRVTGVVLKRGVYYNVHEKGLAAGRTPSIACGDITPERLG
jgi:hypothetical protein